MGAAASQPAASGSSLPSSLNAFGQALLDRLVPEAGASSGGVVISPYGIGQALGMLLSGVEPGGASHTQLVSAVFARPGAGAGGAGSGGGGAAPESAAALAAQLGQLSAVLVKPPSDDLTVADANSAWLARRYRLQPAYAAALKDAFGTAAQPLTGAQAINDWVAAATRGKITALVDEEAVARAALVLVNAVYFHGLWQHAFEKRSTHPADFHLLSAAEAPLQAAMMYRSFKGRTAVQVAPALPAAAANGARLECAAVQLPYRGGEYAAVAAVPLGDWAPAAAAGGQRALALAGGALPYAQALTACRQALLEHLPGGAGGHWSAPAGTEVKVFMPRFELEYSASLSRALRALGMAAPFQGGDITRVALDEAGRPITDLAVSDVIHKVYCKVDEEGTEAAAATAVMMMRCAMPAAPTPEIVIRLDRPFVLAVVHLPTGAALFCGEVHRPEAWKVA